MPIKTPNNYFAENSMGGVTANSSPETTVKGLVRAAKKREEVADYFDGTANKNRQTPIRTRVRRAAGGLLLAATVAAGAHTAAEIIKTPLTKPTSSLENDNSSTTPTSIHIVRPGETPWGIAVDAQNDGFISKDDDIRPTVDDISRQANNTNVGLKVGDRVVVTKTPE